MPAAADFRPSTSASPSTPSPRSKRRLLDLLGQFLGVPVAGAARRRAAAEDGRDARLSLLRRRPPQDQPPLSRDGADDERRLVSPAHASRIDPRHAIVRLAEAAQSRYGFHHFKLKGRRFPGRAGNGSRSRARGAFSAGPHLDRSERRVEPSRGRRALPRPERPGLRRRSLRRGGRLFRPRNHGRISPRHRHRRPPPT